MSYFLVTANSGEARSARTVIAGPFDALAPAVEALDLWLDRQMRSPSDRYHWWIDPDGPDQQLVIEQRAPDVVL